MRKIILAGVLAVAPAFCATARAEDQFSSFAIQQVGKLLSNPPLFFYEFQRNMESTTPLPAGKVVGVQSHLLGGIIIVPLPDVTSAYNVSAKARVHREGQLMPGFPQIDMAAGRWDSLLSSRLENPDASATDSQTKVTHFDVNGSYLAAVVSSSVEPRVRLFWGYKYSKLNIDLGLNKPEDIFGAQVQSFAGRLEEHTVSAGLEHTYALNKRWIIEGGYGLKNKILTAKVLWSGRFVDMGFNIYPESVFIMQPQLNIHFDF